MHSAVRICMVCESYNIQVPVSYLYLVCVNVLFHSDYWKQLCNQEIQWKN